MLNVRLHEAIAEATGAPAPDQVHILQSSSAGATGAIILHAWVGREKNPRAIIKTPREPSLHHAVSREWNVVTLLRKEQGLAAMLPDTLARFTLDEADYYVYAAVPGRTMVSIFRNRVLTSRSRLVRRFAGQALESAVALHETDSRPADPGIIASDLLSDLAWLEACIPDFPATVSDRTRGFAEVIAATGASLPYGRVHGDLSPYNFIVNSSGPGTVTRLIDWEHAEGERPQHLDVFRFMSACALMGRRGAARKSAFRAMSAVDNPLHLALFEPWLRRMKAPPDCWLQPGPLRALWWHFCIHATRREQERRENPTEHRNSTFLRGLGAVDGQEKAG